MIPVSKILPEKNQTSLLFIMTSAFWMAVATFIGLLAATELIAPDLTRGMGWLVFGRLRPMHVNLVLFGFVTPGLLGAAFYYLPRLLKTELFSERLGMLTAGLWNLMVAAGALTLSAGFSQGREYAEFIWPVDMLIVTAMGLVLYNFVMTVKNREEKTLYVSVWYANAAIVLTGLTFALGNVIWRPTSGALTGIPDAIILWFYGHNIFGLLLTPLAAGVAYYVIPRACRNPLYSHTLSLLGFWSLIIVYTHVGTHHLLQVPVPTWLKVIGIVDSVGMVIPVMAFLINIWYTAKGRLGEVHADVSAKFVFTGTIMYFFVSIQGSMMALPDVQRITHFNNWVVGHAHIGVLGFAGMIALGGIYYVLPKVLDRPLYSRFLADLQYWLVLIGVTGFTVVLTIVGLIQGTAWLNGETVYRVLPELHVYYVIRASLGVMIFTGALIGLYNVLRTLFFNTGEAAS
ncbi:cytochrome-c oxidase [Desulfococcus multivorans]|uniref:Cytochrome c oxidase subunit I n=2 Tax=Desulfococcus multivorans TaxID=897 RepID=S7TZA8_DESML|nr:FixN: cytochrome C oxidase, polypeptide subunit (cytochrome cbb3, subunit 1) [Desulfococcus multivorans]AQV01541.1 cytochrome-c oxidase [Desulfococcus multivorans]EPR42387.1 cytochrome c oxidase subunit I [Desulfococcus multivorans DSM 2059]SKA14454.1 cytochrome c oxidase cbb3-type subunit 1 [Desulfococcus multivorans DSM 2059]